MRRTLPVTLACLAVAVLVLARVTPLLSRQPPDGPRGDGPRRSVALTALDANADGIIDRVELAAAPGALAVLDGDRNGSLTGPELMPSGGPPVGPSGEPPAAGGDELVAVLMAFDRNTSGTLTSDELPERFAGLLARADANKDAALTPAEITTSAAAAPAPEGQDGRGGRGRGGDPLVMTIDTDRDGLLSADELRAASSSLLRLDRNGDGQLTPDEHRPMRGPRGGGRGGAR